MEYYYSRVAMHIDGKMAALVELRWHPELCPECNEYHYDVLFGHASIVHNKWRYNVPASRDS